MLVSSELVSDLVDGGKPFVTQKRYLTIAEHLASPTSRRALQGRRPADETKSGLGHDVGRYWSPRLPDIRLTLEAATSPRRTAGLR